MLISQQTYYAWASFTLAVALQFHYWRALAPTAFALATFSGSKRPAFVEVRQLVLASAVTLFAWPFFAVVRLDYGRSPSLVSAFVLTGAAVAAGWVASRLTIGMARSLESAQRQPEDVLVSARYSSLWSAIALGAIALAALAWMLVFFDLQMEKLYVDG